jgi:pimeloyl-ACP methyl ester carboxylesterase
MPLRDIHIQRAARYAQQVYQQPADWLVRQDPDITYIAIEGSDELADWRRNFEFMLTSSSEHLGFGTYARALMAQMWAAGVKLDRERVTVLCGHSLGGAVATVMASILQDHLPLLELVTFGSPRPGGKRFAERLTVPHLRYTHADDIVPHLPSSLLGFRHTAEPIQLDPFRAMHLLRGVRDHDMGCYRRILEDRE